MRDVSIALVGALLHFHLAVAAAEEGAAASAPQATLPIQKPPASAPASAQSPAPAAAPAELQRKGPGSSPVHTPRDANRGDALGKGEGSKSEALSDPSDPDPGEVPSSAGRPGASMPVVPESFVLTGPAFWYNLALSNHLDHLSKGHPTNLAAAITAYQKASEGDCAPALVNLGYAYDLGMGVPRDPSKAVEFYRRAAELGNAVAAYNLGLKYFTGTNGLPLDWTSSQLYLGKAAEEGMVSAQQLLGQLRLDQGSGEDAMMWFTRAAEHGYVPSMYCLGNLLHYGAKGVTPDLPKAVRWYQRAAAADFVPAQYQLGVLFDRGPGVQNSMLAEAAFRKAALHGNREAQYMLGEYYYRGRIVALDLGEAYRWWTLASASGLEVATLARRQLERIVPEPDRQRGVKLAAEFQALASEYRESGIARIEANARPVSMYPMTSGAGFVISDSGHVLACTPKPPDDGAQFMVSLVGGRLRAEKSVAEPLLGLTVVKMEGDRRAVNPLPLQTHRSHIATGSWVFCAHLESPTGSQESPRQVSLRTRIARSTGIRADPRQFCLASRLSESYRGAAVMNESGEILGMVIDPSPDSESVPGALVLGSRYLRDFLRSHGVVPVMAPETDPESPSGESSPSTSPHAGNSLVSLAAFRPPLQKP